MTPSRTREVAEELALRWPAQTRSEQIDAVADALHAAEERGRVAGLKQAAKVAGASDYTIRPDDETVRGWLENATHEEIEREVLRSRQRESDLERELAAAFKAVESKAKHYAAWPETLFDGQSVADELRKLLALLTPTAREAAAATKCIFGHTLVAPGWCAECAAPPKPTDGGENG